MFHGMLVHNSLHHYDFGDHVLTSLSIIHGVRFVLVFEWQPTFFRSGNILYHLRPLLLSISIYQFYSSFDSLMYSIVSWFILNLFYISRQLLWLTVEYTSAKYFAPWIIYRSIIGANLEYCCVIPINTWFLEH